MRRFTLLLIALTSLALVLAACDTTSSDDESAEAADETAAESTDDAVEDAADAEASEDESDAEVAGDTDAEPVDDDADVASTDDEAPQSTDDEAGNGYPADMDEVAELLASEGFALCSDQEAVQAADSIAPELDLASLEAQAHDRTFVAESYANTYVGEVTDDLLIGVSFDSRYVDQADGVSVYLCDSDDISIYLTGELQDGRATLSDDDVEIELEVTNEGITGTVFLEGGEESFTASEASDDAGMYVATDSAGDIDLEVRWVVADDGRQRGRIVCCWPTSHITFACGCCIQQR
jgi:hypothetical protein